MENKELKLININNNSFDYTDPNLSEQYFVNILTNENLNPIVRKTWETRYKNYMLLQKNMSEKEYYMQELTVDNNSRVISRERIEQMKKEKEKSLHFRKIMVRAGMVGLLLAGSGIGLKVYHDVKVKPIKIVNENYNYIPTTIVVSEGQTLTSIATELYANYPEDVQNIKSLNDIIDELVKMNNLKDRNEIREGQKLFVPTYSLKEEVDNSKNY